MMIVAAAIKYKGIVLTGVRHCYIFKDIIELFPNAKKPITAHQGFIDNHNNFMDREESLDYAVEKGQLKDHNDIIGGVLTSEDLW